MDLQEEYFIRKKVPAHLVRYVDEAVLILKGKEDKMTDPEWLRVAINLRVDGNRPNYYDFVITSNPGSDFSRLRNQLIVRDEKWEWDQYEYLLVRWAQTVCKHYIAIPSNEALFVSWQVFLKSHDSWLASFMPYRIFDALYNSLVKDIQKNEREQNMDIVEQWIYRKHEKIYMIWDNIKRGFKKEHYADWLVDIVNGEGGELDKISSRVREIVYV